MRKPWSPRCTRGARDKPPKGMEGHLGKWVCSSCGRDDCAGRKDAERWVCSGMCGACRGFVGTRIEVKR